MTEAFPVTSILSSLKDAAEIAKMLIGLRDTSQVKSKIVELQSAIISAQTDTLRMQSEQFTLLDKIKSLEEKNAKLSAELSGKRNTPEALICPLCKKPMEVKRETPDPHFDFAGVKVHHVECTCGYKSTRQFKSGKYE